MILVGLGHSQVKLAVFCSDCKHQERIKITFRFGWIAYFEWEHEHSYIQWVILSKISHWYLPIKEEQDAMQLREQICCILKKLPYCSEQLMLLKWLPTWLRIFAFSRTNFYAILIWKNNDQFLMNMGKSWPCFRGSCMCITYVVIVVAEFVHILPI